MILSLHWSLALIFTSRKHYVLYYCPDYTTGGVTELCSCHMYTFFILILTVCLDHL